MMMSKTLKRCAMAGGLLLVGGMLAYRVFGPIALYEPGVALRYDDFDFTAISARALPYDEHHGHRIAVTVQVTNGARRVDFDFDPSVVTIVPRDGITVCPSAKNEDARVLLTPGQTIRKELIFYASGPVEHAWVAFSFGGSVGTILDSIIYGRRALELPVCRSNAASQQALTS